MYKVGDLVRFPGDYEGSLDEGYPMGVIIKAISSPRNEFVAEVKWVTGPVAHLRHFSIRNGDMEIVSESR